MGEVTIAAKPAEVQRWLSESAQWPARFPDDDWANNLGRAADGRQVAEFHSKALGKTLTVRMREEPGLITYEGAGKGVTTHGKIFIQPAGAGQTHVIMQTTGELHGAAGALAPKGTKRKRALKKLQADLDALVQLSKK
jgi:hypothetical protein